MAVQFSLSLLTAASIAFLAVAEAPLVASAQSTAQDPKEEPEQQQAKPRLTRPQSAPTAPSAAPKLRLPRNPALLTNPAADSEPQPVDPNVSHVGKYVITGQDFMMQGGGAYSGYQPNAMKIAGGLDKDSVIIIEGVLHGDGHVMAANGNAPDFWTPVFRPAWDVFTDRPEGCEVRNGGRSQIVATKRTFRFTYVFLDTATKPECWNYFAALGTFDLYLMNGIKKFGTYLGESVQAVDPGPSTVSVGPLLPRDPAGD